MKPFLELFEPWTPDEASLKPLIEFKGMDGTTLIQLRIFNVIADLSFVKPWFRSTERKTNWKEPEIRTPIFRYDKFLKGHYTQSFMVLINGTQQVQLDISLARKEDSAITYVCDGLYRHAGMFSQSLEILALYYFAFTEKGCLYLHIPRRDQDTISMARSLGFLEKPDNPRVVTTENLFVLTKEQFENRLKDW